MKSLQHPSTMSKRLTWGVIFLMIGLTVQAQGNDGYTLLPGSAKTLPPGGQMTLYVKYITADGTPTDPIANDVVSWNVNGHAVNALAPTDGDLSTDLTLTKATYTAPAAAPEKNPIAISVTLKSRTGKGQIILVCNVTVLKAQYKISMDAENTISSAGKDIKLHGECYANLKALPDGTFMLEPVDKTRNMNVTVEKGEMVNADGASGRLITPLQYTFPFLFSIGKMAKGASTAPATVYLNTTSPQKGIVNWLYTTPKGTVNITVDIDKGTMTTSPPGQTVQLIPEGTNNMYALDGVTNLNLLFDLMGGNPNLAIQNANQNIANSQDQMAFAKRMQAHMNDPNYFKTAQGKADLQRMQSMNQQIGGNIVNSSSTTKNIDADIAQKAKNDPNYVGSAQFQSDIGKSKLSSIADKGIYQKDAMAQVAPGTATTRIEGSFNAKSGTAFTGNLESSVGPMNTSIKITVEKIN